jgi:hypothetical protein
VGTFQRLSLRSLSLRSIFPACFDPAREELVSRAFFDERASCFLRSCERGARISSFCQRTSSLHIMNVERRGAGTYCSTVYMYKKNKASPFSEFFLAFFVRTNQKAYLGRYPRLTIGATTELLAQTVHQHILNVVNPTLSHQYECPHGNCRWLCLSDVPL